MTLWSFSSSLAFERVWVSSLASLVSSGNFCVSPSPFFLSFLGLQIQVMLDFYGMLHFSYMILLYFPPFSSYLSECFLHKPIINSYILYWALSNVFKFIYWVNFNDFSFRISIWIFLANRFLFFGKISDWSPTALTTIVTFESPAAGPSPLSGHTGDFSPGSPWPVHFENQKNFTLMETQFLLWFALCPKKPLPIPKLWHTFVFF